VAKKKTTTKKKVTKVATRGPRFSSWSIYDYYCGIKGDKTPAEKLEATAEHYDKKTDYIKRKLKEEMGGKEFRDSFPTTRKPRAGKDWTKEELLDVLNSTPTIKEAATALDSSAITLGNYIKKFKLKQVWVEEEGED